MSRRYITAVISTVVTLALVGTALLAAPGDWPQWRGPNRDNKVIGFTAPATWPKDLTKKWTVTVGLGCACPVLVGDKVYTFTKQGPADGNGNEVVSCLEAGTGKVAWQDKHPVTGIRGGDAGYPGPRSTPAVAEGKICTLGVAGVLSCLDANTGKVVWRDDTKSAPQFHTASSPLITDGKCIAYTGGRGNGKIGAYDLNTGKPAWTWTGDGPGYGSPVLVTVDGVRQIVTPTERSLIGIGLADGKLLWEVQYVTQYNSNTPIIDGQTVILAGPGPRGEGPGGTIAQKIEKQGAGFAAKKLWAKSDPLTNMYNTPVLKDGVLYGMTAAGRGQGARLYCQNSQTGDVLWTDSTPRGECGAILDAGSVLIALSSDGNLLAFKPSKSGYEQLAKYEVSKPSRGRSAADQTTWAMPIIAGNRVFVKDNDSLTLWTID